MRVVVVVLVVFIRVIITSVRIGRVGRIWTGRIAIQSVSTRWFGRRRGDCSIGALGLRRLALQTCQLPPFNTGHYCATHPLIPRLVFTTIKFRGIFSTIISVLPTRQRGAVPTLIPPITPPTPPIPKMPIKIHNLTILNLRRRIRIDTLLHTPLRRHHPVLLPIPIPIANTRSRWIRI